MRHKIKWRAFGLLLDASRPEGEHAVRIGETLVPPRVGFYGEGQNGAPDIEADFEVRDGVPECVSFAISAKTDGRAVRTADLHAFNIDKITFGAFMRFGIRDADAGSRRSLWHVEDGALVDEAGWWASQNDFTRARANRRPITEAELREVATTYREHMGYNPTQAVESLGYTRRTAARRVQQAREAGLLPPTSPGKKRA